MVKKIAIIVALAFIAKLSMGMVQPTTAKIEARKAAIEAAVNRY